MTEVKACSVCSGSSANAIYIEIDNEAVLIDAGCNAKYLTEFLQSVGSSYDRIKAVFVTHEHSDHIAGAGVMCRKYHIPVYATEQTWAAMDGKVGAVPPGLRRTFDKREDFYLGQVGVVPFAIPHDAADPVGYRLYGGGVSISTATDLGHFSRRVLDAVAGSSMVLLESNHDPDMLRANPHYSSYLKQRILGNRGHVSNQACAEALLQLVDSGVHHVILGHLSGENNLPELALRTSERRAEEAGLHLGRDLSIDLAWRDRVGGVYTLKEGA